MAQIMEANVGKTAVVHEDPPYLGQRIGVVGIAVLVVKHVAQIMEAGAISGSIVIVLHSGGTEDGRQLLADGDFAVTGFALGGLLNDGFLAMNAVLADVDELLLKVHVAPFQSADLTTAHTSQYCQYHREVQ